MSQSSAGRARKGFAPRLVALAGALVLVGGAGGAGIGAAHAYPSQTIQVKQIASASKLSVKYAEYEDRDMVQTHEFDAGKLKIRATPFKIAEGMKKKDQYLLNLRVTLPRKQKKGGMAGGWAHVMVRTKGAGKVSDASATASRKVGKKCANANLSLNFAFGPIGANVPTGKLNACKSGAQKLFSFQRKKGSASWKLTRLKHMKATELEVYLEVPAGKRPDFTVVVERPIEVCRKVKGTPPSTCRPTEHTATATMKVPTSG